MRVTWKMVIAVAFLAPALPVVADPPGAEKAFVWESLLHGSDLEGWRESGSPWSPGTWSREGQTVTGRVSGHRKARITQGDSSWTNYDPPLDFRNGISIVDDGNVNALLLYECR